MRCRYQRRDEGEFARVLQAVSAPRASKLAAKLVAYAVASITGLLRQGFRDKTSYLV
jgi:hypothetical protein